MRRRVDCTIEIAAAPADVFAALSTYSRAPDWAPELGQARVLAREGDIAVIELELAEERQPLVLELIETRPERLGFAQVDRFRGEGVNGSCSLEPSRQGTRLELSLAYECSLLGRLRPTSAIREAVEAAGQRLAAALSGDRGQPRAPADPEAPHPLPEKDADEVLVVARTGDRLTIELLGTTWVLERTGETTES